MVRLPPELLTAPPRGVALPELFVNATSSRVTVPPLLNSAPPPFASIESHPVGQASSFSSIPVGEREALDRHLRRVDAEDSRRTRAGIGLSRRSPSRRSTYSKGSLPSIVTEVVTSMSVPWVMRVCTHLTSWIVSPDEAAPTAWRSEHDTSVVAQSLAPVGSAVVVTTIVLGLRGGGQTRAGGRQRPAARAARSTDVGVCSVFPGPFLAGPVAEERRRARVPFARDAHLLPVSDRPPWRGSSGRRGG